MNYITENLKIVEFEVNNRLKKLLNQSHFINNDFLEAMQYSTIDGGKRFRPFILYMIGKHFKINEELLLNIGVAVELIHSYTLIHDDLPSMDNDDYRRGKLSSHKQYGENVAILVGDALQSLAFEYLSSHNVNISSDMKIQLIANLATCIGANNLILGQYLDIKFAKNNTLDNITKINLYKTAKLISLCAYIPAIINNININNDIKVLLETWGENLGMIFQMLDDKKDSKDNKPNMFDIISKDEFNNILNNLVDHNNIIAKQLNAPILDDIVNYLLNNKDFK